MRVILVNKFHYLKGGSETYYFGLAGGLRNFGHEVHFFAMQDPKNLPCQDSDLFVSAKDYNGQLSISQKFSEAKSIIYSKESLKNFEALCERVHPDIVHLNLVHRQITLSILDAPYLKQHKVPIFFTSHDYILLCPNYQMLDSLGNICDACIRGNFSNCLKKKCVKNSTAKSALAMLEAKYYKNHHMYSKINTIIAPSRFMQEKLLKAQFPKRQIVLLQNFISFDMYEQAKKTIDYTNYNDPYILFFGRLSYEKGVDLLIHSFIQALPKLPENCCLVIVGDGPERENLMSMSSPAYKRIKFVGFQRGKVLEAFIQKAFFSIVCSRWNENMPYSIMESFASGTPVIGSQIGGIPELVSDEKTGLLCEPNSTSSLVKALVRSRMFYTDHSVYTSIQANCRRYVLNHCSQNQYMQELVSLYQKNIEQKGSEI